MAKPKFKVFLSHNNTDKTAVEELAKRLVDEGIEPWLDKWNIIPGEPWHEALEEALNSCDSCVVFIGPSGIGPWQNEEMRAAIDRRVGESKGNFRVIPVLLPSAEREERSRLPSLLVASTWVEFKHTLEDQDAFHRLVCGIKGIEPGPGIGQIVAEGVCPYRGLQFFDVDHAPFYFGREALIGWLLNEIKLTPALKKENRFLGIVGPSGCGKSSLARAGLIASLKNNAIKDSSKWPIAIFRPGTAPLENLAIALSSAINSNNSDAMSVLRLIEAMRADKRGLHLTSLLAMRDMSPDSRLVLLVDQFEELFSFVHDEQLRESIIENLFYPTSINEGKIIVILTLRSDFYSECVHYPALAAALSEHQILIGPMTDHELLMAIEKPAFLVGCEYEAGLSEAILQDIKMQPGGLPFLQYSLLRLWDNREGRKLTHEAYKNIGRVQGALEQHAEEVYNRLNQEEKNLCRRILLRLTQTGHSADVVKCQAKLTEIISNEKEKSKIEPIINLLAGPDVRLLTIESNIEDKHERIIEISHEAIIKGWKRLNNWLDEDKEFLLWRQRLRTALIEWRRTNHDDSSLLRGIQLNEGERWFMERPDELNEDEREFIQKSINLRKHLRSARNRLRRRITFSLVTGLVVTLILASVAGVFWKRAKNQLEITIASKMATQAELVRLQSPDLIERSVLLAAESLRRSPSLEGDQVLRRGIKQLPRIIATEKIEFPVMDIALSYDDDFLVIAGWDTNLKVIEITSQTEINKIPFKAMADQVALSRNSHYLAASELIGESMSRESQGFVTTNSKGHVSVWKTNTNDSLIISEEIPVTEMSFDYSSRFLAIACSDSMVRVWDVVNQKEIVRIPHDSPVKDVAFSPDGAYLAIVSSDNIVRIWDFIKGEEFTKIECDYDLLETSFSPDGNLLATGDSRSKAQIWELSTKMEIATLPHNGPVGNLVFSPNSKYLATTSGQVARLWSIYGSKELMRVSHPAFLRSIAYSSSGNFIVSASFDGTIRIWEPVETLKSSFMEYQSKITGVKFSPNGLYLTTFCADGIAHIWDLQKTELSLQFRYNNNFNTVSYSPSGNYMASSADNVLRIYDMNDYQEINQIPFEGRVNAVAFSPDGEFIVAANNDTTLRLFELSGKQITRIKCENIINNIAFGLSRDFLAAGSDSSSISCWDIGKEREIWRNKYENKILDINFCGDGKYVMVAENGPSVQVFKSDDGLEIAQIDHGSYIWSAAVSPEGKYIATCGGITGYSPFYPGGILEGITFSSEARSEILTVGIASKIWNLKTGNLITELNHENYVTDLVFSPDGQFLATSSRDKTTRIWSVANWQETARLNQESTVWAIAFSPDGKYLATAAEDRTVRIWPWHSSEMISEACSRLSRNLSWNEWQKYFPGEEYNKTCTNLPVHPSYIAAGEEFARNGEIKKAIHIFERAIEIDSTQSLNPEKKAGKIGAQALIRKASDSAYNGDIKGSVSLFMRAKDLDPELDFDPQVETKTIIVQKLIDDAYYEWQNDNIENAISKFQEAKKMQSNLDLAPTSKAGKLFGLVQFQEGKELAKLGSVDSAFVKLKFALEYRQEIYPNLEIDIDVEAKRIVFNSLINEGKKLIHQNEIEKAIVKFQKALQIELNFTSDLGLNWQKSALQLAAELQIERGLQLAKEGKVKEAISVYKRAQEVDPTLEIAAGYWNNMCWAGCLSGNAKEALYACNQAVELANTDRMPNFQDSRGLARALLGDFKGAINDFKSFVQWSKEIEAYDELRIKREKWINELENGRNQFDSDTLKELWDESSSDSTNQNH